MSYNDFDLQNQYDNNDALIRETYEKETVDAKTENTETDKNFHSGVHLKVGTGEETDMFRDKAYQDKIKPEVQDALEAAKDVFGSDFVVALGRNPRPDDVLTAIDAKIAELSKFEISGEAAEAIVKETAAENGIDLKDFAGKGEAGVAAAVEALTERAAEGYSGSADFKEIESKAEHLMEAREALSDKIDAVRERSDKMNDKIDRFEKVSGYTPRNTFYAGAMLSIKIQAHKDGVPINGHVPKAGEIFIDITNFAKTNLIESVVVMAISSVLDKIDKGLDNDVEKSGDKVSKDDDKPFNTDYTIERDAPMLAVSSEGVTDSGTVTKRMDADQIKTNVECNPAFGAVAGSQLRFSDAATTYTTRDGVTRENTGSSVMYGVSGPDKGSPVIGRILVDMETGGKTVVAADRTVVATFGGTVDSNYHIGDKISSSDYSLRLNQNKVEAYSEKAFGNRDPVEAVKTAIVNNYDNAVDTYKEVALKEISCLEAQKNEIAENKDFLQQKLDGMSDAEKKSDFGNEVKGAIDKCDRFTDKIDARIEKIGEYIEKADSFKETSADYKDGKASLDEAFSKAIDAEGSAVSRSAKFTTDGSRDDWKNGNMFDGVSALDEKDTKDFDRTCDLVDKYDELKEEADKIEQEKNEIEGDTTANETDSEQKDEENVTADVDNENDNDVNAEITTDESSDKANDAEVVNDDVNNDTEQNPEQDEHDDVESNNADKDETDKTDSDNEENKESADIESEGDDSDKLDTDDDEEQDVEENETNDERSDAVSDDKTEEETLNDADVEEESDDSNDKVEDDEDEEGHEFDDLFLEPDDDSSAIDNDDESDSDDIEDSPSIDENSDQSSDVDENDAEQQVDYPERNADYEEEGYIENVADYDEESYPGNTSDYDPEDDKIAAEINAFATEFSYDDFPENIVEDDTIDTPVEVPKEAGTFDSSDDMRTSMDRMNDDPDKEYSFVDFVEAHKDELSEPDGDQKVIDTFADMVCEKGVDNINPDITYSIAYYDEEGFCKGLDHISDALESRGMDPDKIESLLNTAVDAYMEDPIAHFRIDGDAVAFEIPITRDTHLDFGEGFDVSKGDTVAFEVIPSVGIVCSNLFDQRGEPFMPVAMDREGIIPFLSDVLRDVYGPAIGDMANDVADKLKELGNSDKVEVFDKICDHIGDFIEARHANPEEIEQVVDKVSTEIDNEINNFNNDVDKDEFDEKDFKRDFDDDDDDDIDFRY